MSDRLPIGFGIELDADTKQLDASTLFGGSPARLMRLSDRGRDAFAELQAGPVTTPAGAVLARRLTDAGLAHPRPPAPDRPPDVTVVIPVHGRADLLDRALRGLGASHPVLVVDDGSPDPDEIAGVVRRHNAKLLRLPNNVGPGPARNAALDELTTAFVAFLDSDCDPAPGWIDALAGHFADPLVAAVAPRIVPDGAQTAAARYATTRGSLDLGPRPARVVPMTRVSYVPTAALVVRRAAVTDLRFDPGLRYGEDVDLVWRLHEAGWRVRYQPEVTVAHREPQTWSALLGRRFRYGTSAAALGQRHPADMAPLVLHPWSAGAALALTAGRPLTATVAAGGAVAATVRVLRRAGVPAEGVVAPTLDGIGQTWLGVGRYLTQFAAPALVAAGLTGPRRGLAAAAFLLVPPLVGYQRTRPMLSRTRYVAASLADDIAYGAGVWAGCLRYRTAVPLRPKIAWRSFAVSPPGEETRDG